MISGAFLVGVAMGFAIGGNLNPGLLSRETVARNDGWFVAQAAPAQIEFKGETIIPRKLEKPVAKPNVVFISPGPKRAEKLPDTPKLADWYTGRFYRVSFSVSEIYYSILVEQITFSGPTGGRRKVTDAFFLNGFKVGEKLGLRLARLTNLKFVKWLAWDTFLLREGKVEFMIKALPDGKFKVGRR